MLCDRFDYRVAWWESYTEGDATMKTTPEPTENEQEAILNDYIDSEDFLIDFADECFSKDAYLDKADNMDFSEVPTTYVAKWLRKRR